MNTATELANGTAVYADINWQALGTDRVLLDDFEQTGVFALVFTHGIVNVDIGDGTIKQFRVSEEDSGDWGVYARSGIATGRLIVTAPDRLRALGSLLQTF